MCLIHNFFADWGFIIEIPALYLSVILHSLFCIYWSYTTGLSWSSDRVVFKNNLIPVETIHIDFVSEKSLFKNWKFWRHGRSGSCYNGYGMDDWVIEKEICSELFGKKVCFDMIARKMNKYRRGLSERDLF